MLWDLEYNEKEFSIQAAITKGRPLPDWFLDEPAGFLGDDFFLTAFFQLGTCRSRTEEGSPGPIPWDAIVLYADRRGLEPDVSLAFEFIIYEMDSAYIKWYERRRKALTPKTKKPTLRKGKR